MVLNLSPYVNRDIGDLITLSRFADDPSIPEHWLYCQHCANWVLKWQHALDEDHLHRLRPLAGMMNPRSLGQHNLGNICPWNETFFCSVANLVAVNQVLWQTGSPSLKTDDYSVRSSKESTFVPRFVSFKGYHCLTKASVSIIRRRERFCSQIMLCTIILVGI